VNLHDSAVVMGAAVTVLTFVGHAAIAWWRIDQLSRDVEKLWERAEGNTEKIARLEGHHNRGDE
jgi:hypothetical protein